MPPDEPGRVYGGTVKVLLPSRLKALTSLVAGAVDGEMVQNPEQSALGSDGQGLTQPLILGEVSQLLSPRTFGFQKFKLAKVGLEPTDASSLSENDLQQSPPPGGAKSGAVSVETVLSMLAALSPEDRARLAALLTGQAEGKDRL